MDICPECGSNIWQASQYREAIAARERHFKKNREQAIEILSLQLQVAELTEWKNNRNGKIERQRRSIKRLEDRLHSLSVRPHEDKPLGE